MTTIVHRFQRVTGSLPVATPSSARSVWSQWTTAADDKEQRFGIRWPSLRGQIVAPLPRRRVCEKVSNVNSASDKLSHGMRGHCGPPSPLFQDLESGFSTCESCLELMLPRCHDDRRKMKESAPVESVTGKTCLCVSGGQCITLVCRSCLRNYDAGRIMPARDRAARCSLLVLR